MNKLCICNLNDKVWANISSNEQYFQECLDECPIGYTPESLTNQCVVNPPTIIINTLPDTTILTTLNETAIITTILKEEIILSTFVSSQEPDREFEIKIPEEYHKNPDNCLVFYENKCYQRCPNGTCLTMDDPSLMLCIPIPLNSIIYNGICFVNFEEITKNIKSMSENNEIISESGVIIRGYSTKNNEIEEDSIYSTVELGECEDKIIK